MTQYDPLKRAPTDHSAAIIMPAFNEQASITQLVERIKKCSKRPIWVIDDFSADATAKYATEAGARSNFNLLRRLIQ